MDRRRFMLLAAGVAAFPADAVKALEPVPVLDCDLIDELVAKVTTAKLEPDPYTLSYYMSIDGKNWERFVRGISQEEFEKGLVFIHDAPQIFVRGCQLETTKEPETDA